MTLPRAARLGVQRPRWQHLPPNISTTAAADEAIALAAEVGLELDDWQQWFLRGALAERPDGRWAAPTVCLIVPRQNGKGAVLEALELAAVFLWDVPLVVHSAHRFDTSQEHFWRLRARIESSEALMAQMPASGNRGFTLANGKESIRLRNGNRIKFIARSGGAARGFTGDLIIFDEAYDLPDSAMGAMVPALSARTMTADGPGVQIWFTSSAPHADSQTLHGLVRRGRHAEPDDQIMYAEWGNEPGIALDDPAALAAANPALGIRITPEFVQDTERLVLPDHEYLRERLGVAEEPDSGARVFGPGVWAACEDVNSRPTGTPRLALDVHPDLEWATFAGAAARADGLTDLAVLDRRRGTAWLVERATELADRYKVPLRLDPRSAAGGLIEDLKLAGVEVIETNTLELTKACARLRAAVHDKTVRHRAQTALDIAVAGAAVRTVGEAWAWTRLSSQVDISPLMAVTLAYGSEPETPAAQFAY